MNETNDDAWFRLTDECAEASRQVIALILNDVPPAEAWPVLIRYRTELEHLDRR